MDNNYLRYTSLAAEMALKIGVLVFIGVKADAYFQLYPVLTIIGSLLGVFAALYGVIKDYLKK